MPSDELKTLFRDYEAAFSQSASNIARFYHSPCIAARAGEVQLLGDVGAIEAFFSAVLAKYREFGVSHGELLSLSAEQAGANSQVAVATWAYKGKQDTTMWEWTITYHLYRAGPTWKILLQAVHD